MFSKETIQRLNGINIEQVAEALKMQVSHHKTLCPFHADSRPSLTFYLRTNRYRCFVCGAHGGSIDLVMNTQQWPFLQALGISSIATDMPMSHDCRRGWFRGPALLIPYRDIHGKLVSVQSRYLGQGNHPRFQFPKGSRCHIFNLPILKQLQPAEPLFITEGVTDCMALMSAGYKAIAIPSATLLKEEDLKPLKEPINHKSKIINLHMFPDQDEPGEHLFLQLRQLFPTLVRHQLPPGIKDVGELWKIKNQLSKSLTH